MHAAPCKQTDLVWCSTSTWIFCTCVSTSEIWAFQTQSFRFYNFWSFCLDTEDLYLQTAAVAIRTALCSSHYFISNSLLLLTILLTHIVLFDFTSLYLYTVRIYIPTILCHTEENGYSFESGSFQGLFFLFFYFLSYRICFATASCLITNACS